MPAPRPILVILGAPGQPAPADLARIERLAEVRWCTAATLADALDGAEILLLWDYFSRALKDTWGVATRSLRWVHVCAAGVDALLFDDLADSDIVVTNSRGVFDQPIAEYVLASILARDKLIHQSMALQRERVWQHRETRRTAGSSALVIGTGAIGRAIARLLTAVGIRVTGAGRTARVDDPDFGTVIATDRLAQRVGAFDTVVVIAPLTPSTDGLIDAAVLAAMRPDAHLINVGRGRLVDEPALIDALRKERIGAASLDVFATEPLPVDSPLWDLPNVAISPHMSGDAIGWRDELSGLFLDNLERYLSAGSADPTAILRTVVDKRLGFVAGGS